MRFDKLIAKINGAIFVSQCCTNYANYVVRLSVANAYLSAIG